MTLFGGIDIVNLIRFSGKLASDLWAVARVH
jgi:hypothetical protein